MACTLAYTVATAEIRTIPISSLHCFTMFNLVNDQQPRRPRLLWHALSAVRCGNLTLKAVVSKVVLGSEITQILLTRMLVTPGTSVFRSAKHGSPK